ncbi:LINE-1 retrotransposable element ORF1 protein [Plecturocebus cupreus]
MGRNQHTKDEHTKNQNASPPSRDHNSSPTREQSWMENASDELTETGFRSLEKKINDLMELKNTARELCKAYTSFNSQIDQAEERISEIEDQLNEIK